jgi:signal transduction histidine kinase/response regulator RpfG family c-di-GMP phosphodiesterase
MTNEFHPADVADEKVNILIVDDRADKLLAHEVVLAELNQNLVRARSGTEALRCLLREDFAVILLDVNMPGMDGFETAKLIRQRQRNETTPIIFISAVNDTETHVSRGYSLGAVDYILTPVVPEILRAKIAVFVDLYKKTEQVKRQAEERAKFMREQAALAEAEQQQERLAYLAEASNVLATSLEMRETFQNLARLVVPRLADFCLVFALDDAGELGQVAMAHANVTPKPELAQLIEKFPSSGAAKNAARHTFETGKATTCCDLESSKLNEIFADKDDRAFVRSFAVVSCSAIAIRTLDRVHGAILMFGLDEHRACGAIELSVAEELSQRAALALENGRLYKVAQEARMEAERANRAKDGFLAMLSHELRTPLTPVLTSLLALEHDDLPDEVQPALQMIRRNVELEARLIDDLLDLTRISKGKVQLSLETVDAHLLLRNALEICQSEIDHKGLILDLQLAAERVYLEADPARLQQVFWNLIKNAVKFTPKGGRLTLRTGNDDQNRLQVEISDTGCGIDDQSLPKIFNAFEQGERTRQGGLGLGLAISKALVETHRGRLTAASPGRGQGATFTAVFPLTDREIYQTTNGVAPASAERKSLRILLVEDHEDTNRSLTQLLQRRGYQVLSACTVANAIEVAAAQDFDVLVSDIGLPDGSGVDLIRQLRHERPIFGIALTGFGMEEDIRRSHQGGFEYHLIKPVDLNRLDTLIQKSSERSIGSAVAEKSLS